MDCSVTNVLPKPKTITVNGRMIPREAIAREVQNHPAEKPILAWQAAARALVVRELLLQESARLDIQAEPLSDPEGRSETAEEAAMRVLIEREVVTPQPDEAACIRFYEQNRQRFRWETSMKPRTFSSRLPLPTSPRGPAPVPPPTLSCPRSGLIPRCSQNSRAAIPIAGLRRKRVVVLVN